MTSQNRSPLFDVEVAQGAGFVDYDDWSWPTNFGDPEAESRAIRSGVCLWDVDALQKWDVTGADSVAAMQRVFTNNLQTLSVGQVSSDAVALWQTLSDAGGVTVGLDAIEVAGIEAGHVVIDADYTPVQTSPFDLSFDKMVVLDPATIATEYSANGSSLQVAIGEDGARTARAFVTDLSIHDPDKRKPRS